MQKNTLILLTICAFLSIAAAWAPYGALPTAIVPAPSGTANILYSSNGTSWGQTPLPTPFPGAVVPTPAATGDMLYSSDGVNWIVLPIGTVGQCLKPEGSPLVPTWTTC